MANPNPEPHPENLKPFKPGQSGNPGGKTKAQRAAEVQAAEDSAIIRAAMTAALRRKIEGGDAEALAALDKDALKLFKDSEDRAHGTPTQSVNVESPNGTMTPKPSVDVSKLSDAAMAEFLNAASDAD